MAIYWIPAFAGMTEKYEPRKSYRVTSMMYGYGLEGGWYGHTLFGGFFMIIALVAVIVFVVWVVRELSGGNRSGYGGGSKTDDGKVALDILKERYAKGELTKAEFETMKKEIGH